MVLFTRNDTDKCHNGSANPLTPYREPPQYTRTVVAYLRPAALSGTKRTNHVPVSFDEQSEKTNCSTKVRGGGGLEPVKLAREPASNHPKRFVPLANAPGIILKSEISSPLNPLPPHPVCAFDSCAQGFELPRTRREDPLTPILNNQLSKGD